jgi:hypothetical protein
MIYLASPYTDKRDHVMADRYERARTAAAWLTGLRLHVYSPIVHGHAIAEKAQGLLGRGGIPREFEFWEAHCLHMLRGCESMWIVPLDGWLISKGIDSEVKFCQEFPIPIKVIDLDWEDRVVELKEPKLIPLYTGE